MVFFLDNVADVNNFKHVEVYPGIYRDVFDGSVYQSKLQNYAGKNFVTLVWHIDGAPIIKVRNFQMWLITGFLVEVDIRKRFALKNIITCGIWYGESKPNFDLFQLHFVRQIKSLRDNGFNVKINEREHLYYLNIEAALHDLPAKAASLKMKQFNGKFGCSICLHPGERLNQDSLVWVYPFTEEEVELRTHANTCYHAEIAEQTGEIMFGVKGYSVVLDIINIPTEIPLDYMHLVLEGECKRKLLILFDTRYNFMSQEDIMQINSCIKNVKFPHDFSKKVKFINLKSIKKAKAGEIQILLLHLLLPLFKDILPDDIYCHFGLLVCSIQILNADVCTEADIYLAEALLREYRKLNKHFYEETAQTYTNHALCHLPKQRKEHGAPLVCMSNFVFEGFIATFKRQYHGTRGIVSQMVRNIGILQKSEFIAKEVKGSPQVINL